MSEIQISTEDGFVLPTTVFEPKNENPPVILLNPANAVKQSYYAAFATYLAAQGYCVYTYEYRGIGKSKPNKMNGFEATMSDWVLKDYVAVLRHIITNHPESKKIVFGHSFGGQILAILPESQFIDLGVMVASQTGYWKDWKGKGRRMMWALSHLLLPFTSSIWGYVPAKLGLGEDLPKGVALEWIQWIKNPDYLFDFIPQSREYAVSFKKPVLVWSFEDDDYAPIEAVKAFMRYFPNTPFTHHHLRPSAIQAGSIGHFGFYRKKFEHSLWKTTLEMIEKSLNLEGKAP